MAASYTSEKHELPESPSTPRDPSPAVGVVKDVKNADAALDFLRRESQVGTLTPEINRKLLRKIDWMIMPLMWACYFLQYLDKTLSV